MLLPLRRTRDAGTTDWPFCLWSNPRAISEVNEAFDAIKARIDATRFVKEGGLSRAAFWKMGENAVVGRPLWQKLPTRLGQAADRCGLVRCPRVPFPTVTKGGSAAFQSRFEQKRRGRSWDYAPPGRSRLGRPLKKPLIRLKWPNQLSPGGLSQFA